MHEIVIDQSKGLARASLSGVMTMDDRMAVMEALSKPETRAACPYTIIDLSGVDTDSDTWEEIEFARSISRFTAAFEGRHTAVIVNPAFLVSSMVCWNLQNLGIRITDFYTESEARAWLNEAEAA